eukprot:maker-scaffold3945_size7060-snap-gene-0.0 protein:Tk12417 transcript:maker-scaffold3945_size7060-snap-gene-0.0-mRNA-1 annotation:"cytochrome c oxidase"
MQLAWPGEAFPIFEAVLGKWAPGGVMDADVYLALVTIHGTIMVFFVLTAGLSGTFSNLLIPLQIGARDMASGFLNMISSCGRGLDNLSTFKCIAYGTARIRNGNDVVNKRDVNDKVAINYLGILCYCNYWGGFISCITFCSIDGNGSLYFGDCLFIYYCLGSPYVCFWYESVLGVCFYFYYIAYCYSI